MLKYDYGKKKFIVKKYTKETIFFKKKRHLLLPSLFKGLYYTFIPFAIINLLTIMVGNMMPTKYISPSGVSITKAWFMINIVIIGIIGVIWTFIISLFNKEKSIHHIIAIGYSIFICLYICYLFDGFNPNGSIGNYNVNGSQLQATVGLQIVTTLLLSIALSKGIYHAIKSLEVRKHQKSLKQYVKGNSKLGILLKSKHQRKKRRKFRVSHTMKATNIILTLILGIYVITLVGSGFNVRLDVPETYSFSWDSEEIEHEGLSITVDFDMPNMGMYSITDIHVSAEVFTKTTSNPSLLPWYTRIAGVEDFPVSDINAFTSTDLKGVTVAIESAFLIGLFLEDCIMEIFISATSKYGGVDIELDTVVEWHWKNLLESIDIFAALGEYGISDFIEVIRAIGFSNLLEYVTLEYILTTLGEYGIGLLLDVLSLPAFLVLFGLNTVWQLLQIIDVFDLLSDRGLI